MSQPTPDQPPARKLVWAPDEIRVNLEQQVEPQDSLGQRVARVGILAFLFTGLPAFVVFAATTVVAPSVTDGAGIGTTARWAVQVAGLIAIAAMVTSRPPKATAPDPAAPDAPGSTRRITLRLVRHVLVTGGCAVLILALEGLAVGQIATLALLLVGVLHVLPLAVARLLVRRQSR
ncbi:hypothetical protein QQG74_10745 [Micromonospora sp. FIMYZ51]|uniref:hypothetical protein n=1 Tax=Micromonospora sp. FIMYZ51 TaxID=3051832 RepID=UPI0031201D4E